LSLALARKYRPSTFDDLIGQESVSQTLSQALDSKRLVHAYLFSGLRGSGKTSTARIFAKALLCEKGESSHPCDICPNCIMANENRHMDIIEMDAASSRGIDDIKELIEHTRYQPSSARYKLFIIDEVHMLTPQAFNALLKTLEEPPPFVKFILATTDPLKLPVTILSRTQHFRFKKIPHKLTMAHLEHILNLEGIGYEEEAISVLARCGAGSLRDSLTLLDQAIVYSKNFVNLTTVTDMLGIIDTAHLSRLINDIVDRNENGIFDFITLASEYEAEMILDELTLYIKELLFSRSSLITSTTIERFFRVLGESKELLKLGSDGDFVLSLTLFKMMESLEIQEIDNVIKKLEKELEIPTALYQDAILKPATIKATVTKEESIESKQSVKDQIVTEDKERHKLFNALMIKLSDRDFVLGSCFERIVRFVACDNDELSLAFPIETIDTKDDLSMLRQHYKSIILPFVKTIFGDEIKVIISSYTPTQPVKKAELEQSPIKEEDEMPGSCMMPKSDANNEASKDKDPATLLKEPMVEKTIELFEPTKVRIIQKV
jgi:DNA polymerase-3 subunit gamma/tau